MDKIAKKKIIKERRGWRITISPEQGPMAEEGYGIEVEGKRNRGDLRQTCFSAFVSDKELSEIGERNATLDAEYPGMETPRAEMEMAEMLWDNFSCEDEKRHYLKEHGYPDDLLRAMAEGIKCAERLHAVSPVSPEPVVSPSP